MHNIQEGPASEKLHTEKVEPRVVNLPVDEEVSPIVEQERFVPGEQSHIKDLILRQDLPIRNHMPDLTQRVIDLFDDSGVLVLQGETGSGKSVYSPIAISNALKAMGLPDRVVMMQPRRDAASGIARAVAAVTDRRLGNEVGYSTSEAKMLHPDTALRVVTSGIFLRYLISQRKNMEKGAVSSLIIDELHEGTIDYHLVLGVLKMMKEQGVAPFILLTSATLNKENVLSYFGAAEESYMSVEGRSYPVTKEYAGKTADDEATQNNRPSEYLEVVADKVKGLIKSEQKGDILVFLPGMAEIEFVTRELKNVGDDADVLPLHGMLSPEDREKVVFGNPKPSRRRIILSTNIAETSLTVPGIKIVVDSMRQRLVRFNPDTGINERGTEFISRMQAEQRAGRAGRLSNGHCVRIISESSFASLHEHPESEIARVNLSDTMLKMIQMNLDPFTFPFIEPPKRERIEAGIKELITLGALDDERELTNIGKQMVEMPFEPRLSRMIIEARELGCLDATLVMAAFEREKNVWFGPSPHDVEMAKGFSFQEKKIAARNEVKKIQSVFADDGSDLMRNLRLFSEAIRQGVFEASRRDNSRESNEAWENLRQWAKRNYVNPKALTHIAYRLKDYAQYANVGDFFSADLDKILDSTDPKLIGKVIMSGYPDHLLMRGFGRMSSNTASYRRFDDQEGDTVTLSPGSVVFDSSPELCLATAFNTGKRTVRGVEVPTTYANDVHPVSLEDVVSMMGDKITLTSPYSIEDYEYEPVTGGATARYGVTYNGRLLGMLKRNVGDVEEENLPKILAHIIFVSHEDDLPPVFGENASVINQVKSLGEKMMITKAFDFEGWYKNRLVGIKSLHEVEENPDNFRMRIEDFVSEEDIENMDKFYPSRINLFGNEYEIKRERLFNYNDDIGEQHFAYDFLPVINMDEDDFRKVPDNYELKMGNPKYSVVPILICVKFHGEFRYGTIGILKKILRDKDRLYGVGTPESEALSGEALRQSGIVSLGGVFDDSSNRGYRSRTETRKIVKEKEKEIEKQTKREVSNESIEDLRPRALSELERLLNALKFEKTQKAPVASGPKFEQLQRHKAKLQPIMDDINVAIGFVKTSDQSLLIKSRLGDLTSRSMRVIREIETNLGYDGGWLERFIEYSNEIVLIAKKEDPDAVVDISLITQQLIDFARKEGVDKKERAQVLSDLMIASLA